MATALLVNEVGALMPSRIRRLYIGQQTYTWKADIDHLESSVDCHRCIRVRAWANDKNSRALEVHLLSKSWPSPWSMCATDSAYPTPADIRVILTYALAHGWDPTARGGTWTLSEHEHAGNLELDSFLITDRPVLPTAPDPTARVIEAYERRQSMQATASASTR